MCRGPKQIFALSDHLNIPRGFFIMFTSQQGFKSYTSYEGSIFIENFTLLLKKKGTIWTIQKIFAETTRIVSETNQAGVLQTPQQYDNCENDILMADKSE
jgi:hypothetical protein